MIPKVSILVPIYNVSNYIERCAHSLFRQTFEDIEYVFVNDCTPDDSIEKLQKVMAQYPDRKKHVKIVHHEKNRGLATTRNTAIDNSSGDYIQVVDSDDYIEPEMTEILYKEAMKEQADIVVSDLYNEYQHKSVVTCDAIFENQEENFHNMLVNEVSQSYLCNKLIKRVLYEKEDCRVPEGLNYLEDRHVMLRLYYYAKKIVKVDHPFYHYIHYNTGSITKNKSKLHFENLILFWKLLEEFLQEKHIYDSYRTMVAQFKVASKIHLLIDLRSYRLNKEYAFLYRDIEMNYIGQLRRGEKIILWLIHYKLFLPAQIFLILLWVKNKSGWHNMQKKS